MFILPQAFVLMMIVEKIHQLEYAQKLKNSQKIFFFQLFHKTNWQ
jgi:hypothetical protein